MFKQLKEFLQHCWNLMRVMRDEFRCVEDTFDGKYPTQCCLCDCPIEDSADLDWHGFGNCSTITEEHWTRWEQRRR